MKKIILTQLIVLILSMCLFAEELINFNERGETIPIYDLISSTNYSVEFELEIPGMNSWDEKNYT